jgi:hypothetical protein
MLACSYIHVSFNTPISYSCPCSALTCYSCLGLLSANAGASFASLAANKVEVVLGKGESKLVARLKINAIVPLLNKLSLPAFVPHRAS